MNVDLRNHRNYGNKLQITNLYKLLYEGNFTLEQLKTFSNDTIESKIITENSIELLYFCGLVSKNKNNIIFPTLELENFKKNFLKKLLITLFESNYKIFDVNNIELQLGKLIINRNSIPHSYYAIRNFLIKEHVLINHNQNYFEINKKYKSIFETITIEVNRTKTLEELKKELIQKEILGEKAEKYVLTLEEERYPDREIMYVSPFDVTAGFDIISYRSDSSILPDKYIEVKCISALAHFYWSINEVKIAKEKADNYFLYLVDSSLTKEPLIIQNPYKKIYCNENISGEVQSIKYRLDEIIKYFH
ncbi:protein of unknown function [Fictibacillus enclensis]|uniref:Protein NO VEIN C-terminal domain-containing protein n=1 Tax=Fictibacillus enclensis TaxID=1017270 RepID=A0A0V8JDG1_9BACL|nr:DUF3883 domain-containing protein [Fictibacillus enclensis]KSU85170.1 hypothetical protein AS030_06535 [Fictibacillus enclensis]SCB92094.1 protein of unknown function [Fictibacillus enclensis]